jgi:predicted acyl esterase
MKQIVLFFFSFIPAVFLAQNNNGMIDQIEELVTKQTIPIIMPDGAKLMTDIYLPITSDSLVLPIPVPGFGTVNLEVIPKGMQYIHYPVRNGAPNSNPYQLPMILTRTTYDKSGGMEYLGIVGSLLGYAYAIQDNRGVYDSEGAFIPLYNDSWDKSPYYDYQPTIDIFPANSPLSSNKQMDGIHTIDYLLGMTKSFDTNDNGVANVVAPICNGSMGMMGASALAMPNYHASAARKINPNGPGLKGLFNLIASNEHFNHTLYTNGIFRQALVKNWVSQQMNRFSDANLPIDSTIFNSIHSANDYPQDSIAHVINATIDLLTSTQYDNLATYYPNSFLRYATDASMARVDANGNGDINGAFSRYTNSDVPGYHFTGWWDIFTTGQLETWRNIRKHTPTAANRNFQPLIIGPWAHTTIATQSTGDLSYPSNVGDVAGFTLDINNFNLANFNLNLGDVLDTELLAFLRQTLNYNSFANIGEPNVRIPRSRRYQEIAPNTLVRFPGEHYVTNHAQLINFLAGFSGLPAMNIKVYNVVTFSFFGFTYIDTIQVASLDIDIPPLPTSIFASLGGLTQPLTSFPAQHDWASKPAVRAYIVGPQNDGVVYNQAAGNYWMAQDSFPFFNNITWNKMFLHENEGLNEWAPITDETPATYLHDPNDPVRTIGGPNMTIRTPAGEDSHGQLDYTKPANLPYTTNHPGIIEFESEVLSDTLSVIGYPRMKLYASSLPDGANAGDPTNTDFMVRVLDVYPDGRAFYVFEGAVNARARLYAKSLADGQEDINAPFTNIESGEVYEYDFEMFPIGYTFGKEHKIKILVSSSNYPRYQSNPNIPLMEGEFLRWEPGQSANYNFDGQIMQARTAENTVYFQPQYPSYINLPVFGKTLYVCESPDSTWVDSIDYFSATVGWNQVPGASHYILAWGANGVITDTMDVYGISHTITDLPHNTSFIWMVAAECDPDNWTEGDSFTTNEFCDVPAMIWIDEITDSSAVVYWNAVPLAEEYTVYVELYGAQTDTFVTSDTSLLLYPLYSDTAYAVFIEPYCENQDLYSDTVSFQTLPFVNTSVFDLGFENSLKIYPNPFQSVFTVDFGGTGYQGIEFALYSTDGKLVMSKHYDSVMDGKIIISTENLAGGYYLIKIASEEGHRYAGKLFKAY